MKAGTLRLYGMVGRAIVRDGDPYISADEVADDLDRMSAEGVTHATIFLSSDGGLVNEGLAVYHRIARWPGEVTVQVDGVAASIASVIAVAGRRLVMPESAKLMIHDPWIPGAFNRSSVADLARALTELSTQLADIYSRRSGLPVEKVDAMMRATTYLTAAEAKALGFADEVIPEARRSRVREARSSVVDETAQLRAMKVEQALNRYEALLMRQRIEAQSRGASVAKPGQPGNVVPIRTK